MGNKQNNFLFFGLTSLLISLLLTGCANTKVADSESVHNDALAAAAAAQKSPEELLSDAQAKLVQAYKDKLDFYAPLHIQKAADALAKADKIKVDPKQKVGVSKEAIAAMAFLDKGYENKQLVIEHLKPTLDQIGILKELNTPSLLPDDFEDSIDDTVFVIKMIEGGELAEATKKQQDVIADMIEVEIDTLKKTHLSKAVDFMDQADDADADEYAEKTLEAAEKKMEIAQKFFETQYRDRAGVAREGTEALIAAQKAYYVAVDTKKLVKLKPEEAEKHVLRIMSALQKIAKSMELKSLPPNTFDEMAENLKGQASNYQPSKVSVGVISNEPAIEVEIIQEETIQTDELTDNVSAQPEAVSNSDADLNIETIPEQEQNATQSGTSETSN